jgi:hypothetical protein
VSGFHSLSSNNLTGITFTSGTIYTQSGFFKQGTGSAGRYVQLTFTGLRFTQFGYANFDLQLGVVTAVSGTSADTNRAASIENYGNGWYRCRFTATCNSDGTGVGVIPVLITASGDTRLLPFTGVTGDILYGWGVQTETGSVATSYIPTTTGSVTRNTDVINLTGATDYIGQTEGTLYAEVDIRNLGTSVSIINVQTTSYVSGAVRIDTNALNQLRIQIRDASGVNCLDATLVSPSPTLSAGINKIAVGYSSDASGVVTALNGSIIFTTTVSGSFGTLGANRVYLGTRETSGSQDFFINNRFRTAAVYNKRLSNQELIEITS